MKRPADEGYAIVAAVAALAVFASIAFAVLASDRADLTDLRAQYARARLESAADAGLTKAIEGLAISDVARRWPIDGRPENLSFDQVKLTVVVEDERGKIPLADLQAEQLHRLFAGAGVEGDHLRALVDAYEDLSDSNADPKRHAAQIAQYHARGLQPLDGTPVTVEELARLNGMDAATFAKIRPVLTPYFGASGVFTPETASPLAIRVMSEEGENGPEALERQRELEGERPATQISVEKSMAGHAVTVVVRAQDPEGGQLVRRTVVEFTGAANPAYYIREAR